MIAAPRSALRLLVACAAAAFLAEGALAARVAPNRDWVPLQAGNRWSYRVSTDRVIHLPGGAQFAKVTGTDVDEVSRALGPFAGARNAFELVRRSHQRDASTGREEKRRDTTVVSADGGGMAMITGESEGVPIRILRPVMLLPASPEPGRRWDVGAFAMAGLQFDLEGEVQGFEDVRTPAGDFRGCLKLHFTGTVRGSIDVGGTAVPVEGAGFEATEWYAPGVGMVRERSLIRLGLRMPDGTLVESDEASERVLDGFQVGTVPAARAR